MRGWMRKKSQLLEGSRNIKIRLVIKLKGLKDLLFQGGDPQKTTFAIIVMVKVISAGIAPGTIYLDQNVNKVEKSNPDTSDDITGDQEL